MKSSSSGTSSGWFKNISSFLPTLFRTYFSSLYFQLPDSIKIWWYKDDFIFNELSQRALNSPNGIIKTSVGLPFFRTHFVVVTNPDLMVKAISYGEYHREDKDKIDPHARKAFDGLGRFLKRQSVINLNGPTVYQERKTIKDLLTVEKGVAVTQQHFSNFLNNWSEQQTVNRAVFDTVTRIIGKTFFNMDDIPQDVMPLLYEAETYVHENFQEHLPEIAALEKKLEALNQAYIEIHKQELLSQHSYLRFIHDGKPFSDVDLTTINDLGALIVSGNISALLIETVLYLSSNRHLQSQLQDELSSLNLPEAITLKEYNEKIKNAPFLNLLYLEALRYFSPTPTIPRFASKPGRIGDVSFPANTWIFIPIRQILHDPKLWANPEEFDPSRHLNGEKRLGFSPFTPFSTGPRQCPAAYGFAETVFKTALTMIFRNNSLQLTSHQDVETIPVAAKAPRFHQLYHAQLHRGVSLRTLAQSISISPTPEAIPSTTVANQDFQQRLGRVYK